MRPPGPVDRCRRRRRPEERPACQQNKNEGEDAYRTERLEGQAAWPKKSSGPERDDYHKRDHEELKGAVFGKDGKCCPEAPDNPMAAAARKTRVTKGEDG